MSKLPVISVLICATTVSGCWKSIRYTDMDGDIDAGGDGDTDIDSDSDTDSDTDADGGYVEPDPYVDPGCDSDPGAPPEGDVGWLCDQYTGEGCGDGEACYTYIVYPTDPCTEEQYGTTCAPAGYGAQGDYCQGFSDCGAGYSCFVTGEGTQCLALCSILGGEPRCPPGLVCGFTDVPEVGACL